MAYVEVSEVTALLFIAVECSPEVYSSRKNNSDSVSHCYKVLGDFVFKF